MRVSAACLAASAAATPPFRPSTKFWSRSISRGATTSALRRLSSCLGVELVKRLLVSALRLLDLTIRGRNVGLRHDHRRIDFYDTPLGHLEIGFLLGAVELEDGRALLDLVAPLDVNLAHAAVCFRQNRNGAEKRPSRWLWMDGGRR